MAYGTWFTSINPLRRRMAQSTESVSPGMVGIITSVDTTHKTVDCLVQNGAYYLRNLRYSTTVEDLPSYIKVRSVVYIRRSTGNKQILEVAGPSYIVPSQFANNSLVPDLPADPDAVITGLEVKPSSLPAMTVAITVGQARMGGTVYNFTTLLVGESQSAKVSGGSAPGIPLVGNLYLYGSNYTYLKINAAPSATSGQWRYDQIELNSSRIVVYRAGTASSTPTLQTVQPGSLLLGSILVRPGATSLYYDDINATFSTSLRLLAPSTLTLAAAHAPQISIGLVNQSGNPVVNAILTVTFKDTSFNPVASPSALYGTLTPFPSITTDSTGAASFVYDNTTATNSARIQIREQSTGATALLSVYNLDASGNVLPF